MTDISLREAIFTQRAVRVMKPDPVSDELIDHLLEAATRAPSARNTQPWRFIVVRDPAVRTRLGELFLEAGKRLYPNGNAPAATPWSDVPVLIAVCSQSDINAANPNASNVIDASVYPAVQNLLLTARGLGLAAYPTTRWMSGEAEVRGLLKIPAEIRLHALIPVGWAARPFGPTRRRPVSEIAFRETYGSPWERA